GEGSWIGAGTTIIPGVKVGKWSVIGAGSVVTKDIPDNVLAVGNRCKIIKNLL
ncbi:acetyltransferase, partial [Bacteroides intestinalis]